MFLIGLPAIGAGIAALSLGLQLLRRREAVQVPVPELRAIPLSSGPARWVVGRARAGGLVARHIELSPDDPATGLGTFLDNSARVSGALYRDLHLAIAISEGAVDGLEAIFLDGKRVDLHRAATLDDGGIRCQASSRVPPYGSARGDLFLAILYGAADGNQGATLRSIAGVASDAPFFSGISWLHLLLRQPPDAVDQPFGWESLPEISFLIRGVRVGGAWTDSAVGLRQWWHEHVLGRPGMDPAFLGPARARGDEVITTGLAGPYWRYASPPAGPHVAPADWSEDVAQPTVALPVVWVSERIPLDESEARDPDSRPPAFAGIWQDPFPWRVRESDGTIRTLRDLSGAEDVERRYRARALQHSVKRYRANGVIMADLGAEALAEEWDFATQGLVVHTGHRERMLVGEDSASVLTWDVGRSVLREWGAFSGDEDGPPGSLRLALAQSEPSDFLPEDLPPLGDGKGEAVDLNRALLVNHPIDGGRLLTDFRNRSRHNRRCFFRAMPHLAGAYDLRPGDIFTCTLPQLGLDSARCAVDGLVLHSSLELSIELTVSPAGAYTDSISLPDEGDRPPVVLPPVVPRQPARQGASVLDAAWNVVERQAADAIPSSRLSLALSVGETKATRLLMFLTTAPEVPVHSPLRYGYWLPVLAANRDGSAFGHLFRDEGWDGNADGTFNVPGDIPSAPSAILEEDAVVLSSTAAPFVLSVTPYAGDARVGDTLVRPIASSAIARVQDLANVSALPDTDGQAAIYRSGTGKFEFQRQYKVITTETPSAADADYVGQILIKEESE